MKIEIDQMEEIRGRLRKIRVERRWSLEEVEERSKGAIKAVVLGSYERGNRQMSVRRLIEISHFYGVPISSLFEEEIGNATSPDKFTFDRRKIAELSKYDEMAKAIARYLSQIATIRKDWNQEVITIRREDSAILSTLFEIDLKEWASSKSIQFGKLKS